VAQLLRDKKREELSALGDNVELDIDSDLNAVPDCLPKYKAIVERAK
jgi:hypothetical protein